MDWSLEVKEISPPLYRYFCACFPHHLASDLVQDVLLRMVRLFKEGRFDETKGSSRMFAFGIAHFVRLETLSSLRRNRTESLDGRDIQECFSERSDQILDLRKNISKLPEDQQRIILLLITNDLSIEEIAALTEIPVGSVKSHIHRAKENLRRLMDIKGDKP